MFNLNFYLLKVNFKIKPEMGQVLRLLKLIYLIDINI